MMVFRRTLVSLYTNHCTIRKVGGSLDFIAMGYENKRKTYYCNYIEPQ